MRPLHKKHATENRREGNQQDVMHVAAGTMLPSGP